MNKALKKSIEAELTSLINAALSARNKMAASKVAKNIKSGAKNLAKKFVKQLPVAKSADPRKTTAGAKKSATKKKVAVKRKTTGTRKK
jgi:hypothetical protein